MQGSSTDHWAWRLQMARLIASRLDADRFGVTAMYVIGSTKNATAGPASDIDLLVHFHGTEKQRKQLLTWFEGWSLGLDEANFIRTGQRTGGLLDIHFVTDNDIAMKSSFAVKINSPTDPARPLPLGNVTPSEGSSGG
jgi:pyruvate,water dikinase